MIKFRWPKKAQNVTEFDLIRLFALFFNVYYLFNFLYVPPFIIANYGSEYFSTRYR